MEPRSVAPVLTTCPSCGLPLRRGATVCPSCGTLPALERLPRRLLAWADSKTSSWRPELNQVTLVIWGLALAPCLVVPPILAIVLAWRGPRGDGQPRMDATWVTIVALANVALSLVLIMRFGHEVLSAVEAWRASFRPHVPSGRPRLTPI